LGIPNWEATIVPNLSNTNWQLKIGAINTIIDAMKAGVIEGRASEFSAPIIGHIYDFNLI
jgi:hypothetical protein